MRSAPRCPRCGLTLHPPGLWDNAWSCPQHGYVAPMPIAVQPTIELVSQVAARSALPLWVPWPLPRGWLVTGVLCVGTEPETASASLVALSGPNPLGGGADLLLVAEEPGVGLGARCSGLAGPDAGGLDGGAPAAKASVRSHPLPLWLVPATERCAAFVGEWEGRWLWVVLRPPSAGALLTEHLVLQDLRDLGGELSVLPCGALSPWVAEL